MKSSCYIPSGCSISAMMSESGKRIDGRAITKSIALMHDRSNGLGGGFAAYGIYPRYAEQYAFHMMFNSFEAKGVFENYLKDHFYIVHDEEIPTRPGAVYEEDTSGINIEYGMNPITESPVLWRYFVDVPGNRTQFVSESEYVFEKVMEINSKIEGAFVASSGKNMGIFKGLGYPEDIAAFYNLDEYKAYIWTAHGRFPTNTPGWWGGAHPFGLLDWSIVHNGEISSYGINKRYLEPFGYRMELKTDTEVVAYMFDLLVRRHNIPIKTAISALSAPFWKNIDKMPERERKIITAIRQVYGSALLNGPYSIVLGHSRGIVGFNDRIKLRPMTCARKDNMLYMSSEESAIREIEPNPDTVWSPKAGTPVIGELYEEVE
ncbi:glutamine amidotransferase family protein [Methanohalobium sp.]|uniref:class II glutamine amidotransferase n=1 Tax=Methanohalobium sp. TaxID=2837493 RepID=UPI0025E68A3F|nr:glutamine amidotransferase family protein [Methanohalobium sp.]